MSLSKPSRHQMIILSILHQLICTDPLHSGWLPSLPWWTWHTTHFHSTGFLGNLQSSQSNIQELSTLNIQYTSPNHRLFVVSLVKLSRVNLGVCYFLWTAHRTWSPSMTGTPVCTPPRNSLFLHLWLHFYSLAFGDACKCIEELYCLCFETYFTNFKQL